MNNLILLLVVLVLSGGSTTGFSEDKEEGSKSAETTGVRVDSLLSQLIEELENAAVRISLDVYRGDLDSEKADMARGLHEGYLLTERAHELFRKSLRRYPLINEESMDVEAPDFCDYTGFFAIHPRNADHYYLFELDTADRVVIAKYSGNRAKVASVSGRWVDCELTVFRICQIMRNHLWPKSVEKPTPDLKGRAK